MRLERGSEKTVLRHAKYLSSLSVKNYDCEIVSLTERDCFATHMINCIVQVAFYNRNPNRQGFTLKASISRSV